MNTRHDPLGPRRHGRSGDDRGAVMLWVAIMIPVLLVAAALVIDIGALYVERRALQNGADAAALAVAQECAGGACSGTSGLAGQYVGLNRDGARADLVCGSAPGSDLAACPQGAPALAAGASGWARVRSANEVNFQLMPGSKTVTADAVAAWGPLGRGAGVPLIFSVCEFQFMGGNLATGAFPSGATYIYFHGIGGSNEPGVASCTASPSGQDLPGGFGWLSSPSGSCEGSFTAGQWAPVKTGVSATQDCRAALPQLLGTEIVILMFDDERGQGSGGEYHVAGFAGFRLLGYRFGGSVVSSPQFVCPEGSGKSADCVHGEFTRVSTSGLEFGGSDFGVRAIRMVG